MKGQGRFSPEQLPACCDVRVRQVALLAVWTACPDQKAPAEAEVRLQQLLKVSAAPLH